MKTSHLPGPVDYVIFVSTKESLLMAARPPVQHPGAHVIYLHADPARLEQFAGFHGKIEVHILDDGISRRILEILRSAAPEEDWIREYRT